jgi:hypothetical protein
MMVHTPDLVRVHRRFSGPDRRSKKWIRILSPRPIFVVFAIRPNRILPVRDDKPGRCAMRGRNMAERVIERWRLAISPAYFVPDLSH